jgi:hypothetical protein
MNSNDRVQILEKIAIWDAWLRKRIERSQISMRAVD